MDWLVELSNTVDPAAFGGVFIPLFINLVELLRLDSVLAHKTLPQSFAMHIPTQ